MKRLNLDKEKIREYALEHTLNEVALKFCITRQQAKDYCRHHSIKYKLKEQMSGESRNPLYTVWKGIIGRCENSKNKDFERYGGRGIKVCEEWKDVRSFISWCNSNGYKKGLQIDRIDNNKDYCPSNCRFISPKENMANRRNTLKFEGEALTTILEDKIKNPYGIERHTFWYRIKVAKWSVEKALSTPLRHS